MSNFCSPLKAQRHTPLSTLLFCSIVLWRGGRASNWAAFSSFQSTKSSTYWKLVMLVEVREISRRPRTAPHNRQPPSTPSTDPRLTVQKCTSEFTMSHRHDLRAQSTQPRTNTATHNTVHHTTLLHSHTCAHQHSCGSCMYGARNRTGATGGRQTRAAGIKSMICVFAADTHSTSSRQQ